MWGTAVDSGRTRLASEKAKLGPAKIAGIIIAVTVFFFMVAKDVTGLEAKTRKISQDMTARVMAPFYPAEQRDDVLVILFDNRFLREGGTWPAAFSSHAFLINRLASFNPKSVFYDIIFGKRDGDYDTTGFVNAIKRLERKGIPFYYPQDVNDVALGDIGAVSNLVRTQWDNHGVFYPPTYKGMQTPAFRIYHDGLRGQTDQSDDQALSQWPDMFVYWGSRKARELDGYWKKFRNGVGNIFERDSQPRPYIRSVSYNEFFSTNDRDELRELVSGKHVIVGTSIDGIQDYVSNPVDGQAPGAFLHAMALDNLLTFGKDYFRDGDKMGLSILPTPLLVELVTILGVFVLWWWINGSIEATRDTSASAQHQRWHRLKYLGYASIVSIAGLCVAFWYINIHLRSDPGNVIGVLSLDLPILAFFRLALEMGVAVFIDESASQTSGEEP